LIIIGSVVLITTARSLGVNEMSPNPIAPTEDHTLKEEQKPC